MRRATIRTTHERGTSEAVANALRPDNTPEMATRVVDDRIVTTIERETTGGLRSTVDDYVVNLGVANEAIRIGIDHGTKRDEAIEATETDESNGIIEAVDANEANEPTNDTEDTDNT